jgi:hypothetical protein
VVAVVAQIKLITILAVVVAVVVSYYTTVQYL